MKIFVLLLSIIAIAEALRWSPSRGTLKRMSTSLRDEPSDSATVMDVVEPVPVVEDLDKLKKSILLNAAQTSRGELDHDRQPIETLVERLEASMDASMPVEALNGKWNLIYSSTYLFMSSPFFMAARGVCEDGEEAERFNYFCKLHREALAFTQIGEVSQYINHLGDEDEDEPTLVSEFESKVAVVPGLPIVVKGVIQSSSTITDVVSVGSGEVARDLRLMMDTVRIKKGSSNLPFANTFLDRFKGLNTREMSDFLEENLPKDVRDYKAPLPVFRTTYVDQYLRVSRNQDNEIFVYAKCGV